MTDRAKSINKVRAELGLPPIGGEDGDLTIVEYVDKHRRDAHLPDAEAPPPD